MGLSRAVVEEAPGAQFDVIQSSGHRRPPSEPALCRPIPDRTSALTRPTSQLTGFSKTEPDQTMREINKDAMSKSRPLFQD